MMLSETFIFLKGGNLSSGVIIATISGVICGISLGLADYYVDKLSRKLALGIVIIIKTVVSISVLISLFALNRFVFSDLLILPAIGVKNLALNEQSWMYLFHMLGVYYFSVTLLINFINQVNKKYGPGVLIPLLLGRYRSPKEEERIFLFMDLKSSTSTAERLGHLNYSAFIRDCFADINQLLSAFHAEIYQYVGDEIVVTWQARDGLRNSYCIEFFFACMEQFRLRTEYYMKHYDLVPTFKASLHMGKVTAVEIGEIKRDIAYHGDTLNTTARIQGVCNEFNRAFIVSEYLLEKIDTKQSYKIEALGRIRLRGKAIEVSIASVDTKP
jgi:adenylate cyclase